MKKQSKIFLSALCLALLGSCTQDEGLKPNDSTQLSSSDFFKQNISIFDARLRSTNNNKYVRELFLANFSDVAWDKSSVGFEGFLFEDNGRGNDLVEKDGIYTSVRDFMHDGKIPFVENGAILSVLETPIVSPEFTKMESLEEFSLKYEIKKTANGRTAGPVATVTCKVEICSTGCIADWIWSGFGCICVSDCSATVGWQ
jgi:hypothetical protein